MNRSKRAEIAKETVEIIDSGKYTTKDNKHICLTSMVQKCISDTKLYEPAALNQINEQVLNSHSPNQNTTFIVANETTLEGAVSLLSQVKRDEKVGVLNFASAMNPGGGFLNGSQAQEESLARSSALYKSLLECPEYYEAHRADKSFLFSHRMIHTPNCPVFRNDNGELLSSPYVVDFITSPAPNAGAIAKNAPHEIPDILPLLTKRTHYILSLALYNNLPNLVLGAWGCGVFKNDPAEVAKIFKQALCNDGPFSGRFKEIRFSVFDQSPNQEIFQAFQDEIPMDR